MIGLRNYLIFFGIFSRIKKTRLVSDASRDRFECFSLSSDVVSHDSRDSSVIGRCSFLETPSVV